jgi:secondary thiamine-phosphate synthase enzyme
MRQSSGLIEAKADRQGLHEITHDVAGWVKTQGFEQGLLTLFCSHTSASLLIQENAAPDARRDLEAFFQRVAPEREGLYAHDDEGPDDMPAHLRAALTQTQLSIPLLQGRLALGRWQGIYLFEHRRRPQVRTLVLHLLGD